MNRRGASRLKRDVIGALALCVIASACTPRARGEQVVKEALSPMEGAVERATRERIEASAEAFERAESLPSYDLVARYNPGRCGAPDFEVYARGAWRRAALTGRDETSAVALEQWRQSALKEPMLRLSVTGRWDERVWTTPEGAQWPVFEVFEVRGAIALNEGSDPGLAQRSSGARRSSEEERLEVARCAASGASRSVP